MAIDKQSSVRLVEETPSHASPSQFHRYDLALVIPSITTATSLKAELAYVKANSNTLVGFTAWSAGSFDTKYNLTLTPNADGTDQPLWTQAGEFG